jgi:hypothetical protein
MKDLYKSLKKSRLPKNQMSYKSYVVLDFPVEIFSAHPLPS